MPLIDDFTGTGFVNAPPIPTEDNRPEPKPGEASLTAAPAAFSSTFGAEFEQNNILGSIFYDEDIRHRFSEFDPDFNLGEELKGTGFENAPELFVSARNRDHLHALISDVNRERANRTIIEQSSWATWLPAMVTAQLADPINLFSLGGGAAAKFAGRKGYSLLSRSAIVGAGIGVDTAAQEAILQAGQQERTAAETVGNIGGSVILGGLLGYGANRLLSAFEQDALSRGIERDLGDVPGDQAPDPFEPGTFRGNLSGEGASLSAAMVAKGADDYTVKSALGVEKLLKDTSPLSRTMMSESKATRLTANELAESPYHFNENVDGVEIASRGSRMGTPGAVETRVKSIYEYPLAQSLQEVDRQFVQYRLGRAQKLGDKTRISLADSAIGRRLGGARPDDVLSETQFREAIYDALNAGGKHGIKEVEAAAGYVQRTYLDLIQQGAAETGISKAALPRSYKVGNILADLPRFREIVIAHLSRRRGFFEAEAGRLAQERAKLEAADIGEIVTGGQKAAPAATVAPQTGGTQASLTDAGLNVSGVSALSRVPDKVITPDGSLEVPVTYKIVELRDLKYASGDLQPRDRSRKESQIGARDRAANLDPERLLPSRVSDSGAPLVLPDGTILSGNGRTMSIEQAYRDPALKAQGDKLRAAYGEQAKGFDEPVLVGALPEGMTPEQIKAFADLSNRSNIAQMSATERAIRDSKAAGPEIMGLYQGGAFTSKDNEAFFRAFLAKVVTENELGSISKGGALTKEGEDRLTAAVLAAAYEDADFLSRLLESTDDNIRAITGAMKDAAGDIIRLKDDMRAGVADPQFDIVPQIVDVARIISQLREKGIKPDAFLAQGRMFGEIDPVTEALIRAFYNSDLSRALSREKITEVLKFYAQEARKKQPGGGLFEDTTTPVDIVTIGRDRALKDSGEVLAASDGPSGGSAARSGDQAPGQAARQGGQPADRPAPKPARSIKPTKAEEFALARAMDEDAELGDLADEVIRRMTNKREGRMSYDMHKDVDAEGFELEGARLREEDFDLPYNDVREYVERDIEIVMQMMRHGMAPDIEIARRFGSADMREPIRKIQQEYQVRMRAAESEAERLRLAKMRDRDIADIRGMRDRISSRYGLPEDPAAFHVKWPRRIRDFNVATKLGNVVLSSASDAGKLVWARGVGGVFGDLLVPMMRNWSGFMGAMDDVKMAGTALDVVLDSRAMAFAEGTVDFGGHSRIDRFSREASKTAMRLAGMTHWNAGMKQMAGVLVSKNILEASESVAAGTASKKQIAMLARGGISTENAVTIAEQFKAHGSRKGGVWRAEAGAWAPEARAAREAFLGAIRRDVDTIIVTPGQDLPLFMSKEGVKFFTQFKSFAASSMHRTLIAGLQQRDFNVFMGMFSMFAFAMVANEARRALNPNDKEKPFAERWADPAARNQIILEAIDRAGIFGWLGDVNSVLDKAAGAGLSNAFGTGQLNTRYGVTLTDQLAGPGIGTINDVGKIASSVVGEITGNKEWKESDTRRLRRQIPFIGVFYIRALLDQLGIEQGVNELVGAEPPAR
jgi:hypothetical protein